MKVSAAKVLMDVAGLAVTPPRAASAAGLKVFFGLLELLLLSAGFYILRHRQRFFGFKGENHTYASANLRMIMVVLIWVHAVILTALMIFEV